MAKKNMKNKLTGEEKSFLTALHDFAKQVEEK